MLEFGGSFVYDEISTNLVDVVAAFSAGDRLRLPGFARRTCDRRRTLALHEELVSEEGILDRALSAIQAGDLPSGTGMRDPINV